MNLRPRLFSAGLELTLACPCRCETCGSSAGRPRRDELATAELHSVIRDLRDLGCRRVTFLGGEPLERPDWPELAAEGRRLDLSVDLITSGLGVDRACAREMRRLGLASVTVSVDGTAEVHDKQRRVEGAHEKAMAAIRFLDEEGLRVGVTSQVNTETLPTLEALAPRLEEAGAIGWQLQLTMPAGRAVGRADLTAEAGIMPALYTALRRLVRRRGLRPFITDNIGYMTPDDPVLRTPPGVPERCWMGCFAGLRTVGITSVGGVKGCLSLPDSLLEGSVRQEPLAVIWNDPARFSYNRAFDPSCLGGPCSDCQFGEVCRGGCTAMAMAVHGKPGISTHCLRGDRHRMV